MNNTIQCVNTDTNNGLSLGALSVLNFFKSQLHWNGTKLGDFYGIWNVNTKKFKDLIRAG